MLNTILKILHRRDFKRFVPVSYLNEYYATVIPENDKLMDFFADVSKKVPKSKHLLEYGGGPTIYQLISLTNNVSNIDFTDYLESNNLQVRAWLKSHKNAHNWRPFVGVALFYELGSPPTSSAISARERRVKSSIKTFGHVDAFNPKNDKTARQKYDIVSSNFVAESISSNITEWRKSLRSVTGYVDENGWLVMTAIRNARYWRSGEDTFAAYAIQKVDLERELKKLGFKVVISRQIDADQVDPTHPEYEGYDGMVFVLAQKVF